MIPSIPTKRCGGRSGLTFRVPINGTIKDCMTLPVDADTGKVWVIFDNGKIMQVPLFGPEGVIDTGEMLLDSPIAMCHAARWLAGRVGWPMQHIVTAPEWRRVQTDKGPEWVLSYGNYMLFVSDVPGISDITDPAEALAAACRAVGAPK